MSDSLYHQFTNYIRRNVSNGTLQDFKSDSNVTYMLEHVTEQFGYQYYEYIKKHTSLTTEQITSYCKKNDTYGGGKKCNYGWITTSPSNFRYLLQSHIILTHMKRLGLKDVCVAEIGGGSNLKTANPGLKATPSVLRRYSTQYADFPSRR